MKTMRLKQLSRERDSEAFTLTELLVVIVILVVLQIMLIPAMGRSQQASKAIVCENNLRQLTAGWLMYSTDNAGEICPTGGMDVLCTDPTSANYLSGGAYSQWCLGSMSLAAGAVDERYIRYGLLYPYVNNIKAYHCPADRSTASSGQLRLRSVAMNCWMNPINAWSSAFTKFRKQPEVLRPSATFLLIEVNPLTISGGWFVCDPATPNMWIDIPATTHDGAAVMSFCDGRVSSKVWTDPAILTSNVAIDTPVRVAGDLQWLQSVSSY